MDAQEEHDLLKQKPDSEKVKQLLRQKPLKESLVERVMERHGLTREQALEEIEKFGG